MLSNFNFKTVKKMVKMVKMKKIKLLCGFMLLLLGVQAQEQVRNEAFPGITSAAFGKNIITYVSRSEAVIYERGTNGKLVKKLTIGEPEDPFPEFGRYRRSVAINDKYALIATNFFNNIFQGRSATNIEVYKKSDNGEWGFHQIIEKPDFRPFIFATDDIFGRDGLIINDKFIVTGGKRNIYTYELDKDGLWKLNRTRTFSKPGTFIDIALDGNILGVTPGFQRPEFAEKVIYIYKDEDTHWALRDKIPTPTLCESLDIKDGKLIAGSSKRLNTQDASSNQFQGTAYVYKQNNYWGRECV